MEGTVGENLKNTRKIELRQTNSMERTRRQQRGIASDKEILGGVVEEVGEGRRKRGGEEG